MPNKGTIETTKYLVDYTFEIEKKWSHKKVANIKIVQILGTSEFYETTKHKISELTKIDKDLIKLKCLIQANDILLTLN